MRRLPRDVRVLVGLGTGPWSPQRGFTDVTELDRGDTVAGAPRGGGPPVDMAVLPVGAYVPRSLLRSVHLDPEEAVRAAGDLGARVVVPVHRGTFVLSGEPVLEPVERTRAAWAVAGRDRADLWDLAIGETRTRP